jgi:tRNA (cytosine38-C5)-methyltransferase
MSLQDFENRDDDNIWTYIPTHGQNGDWDTYETSRESTSPTEAIRSYLDEKSMSDVESACIPDRVLAKWGRLFDIVLPSSQRTCCFTRGMVYFQQALIPELNSLIAGYTQLVERTGSILQTNEELDVRTLPARHFDHPVIIISFQTKSVFDEFLQAQVDGDENPVRILKPLGLRYFTPRELLRLFYFEPLGQTVGRSVFRWPNNVSNRTKYRLIGNSVNVKVVTELINFLFES